MGRHAQPRELAELKGATRHDPQRYRTDPPKSGLPIGNAPDHLSSDAQSVWFELETYALNGVLTGADRLMLETLSVLVAQFRADPEGFSAAKMGHMIGCLARLGMSPADRQKLGVAKQAEANPFDEF
jgi:phage terminase small subunit